MLAASVDSQKNLSEKVENLLSMMFSANSISAPGGQTSTINNKVISAEEIKLKSIDAAKALNYQWLGSECRHSFIKALGVDSRNIVSINSFCPILTSTDFNDLF